MFYRKVSGFIHSFAQGSPSPNRRSVCSFLCQMGELSGCGGRAPDCLHHRIGRVEPPIEQTTSEKRLNGTPVPVPRKETSFAASLAPSKSDSPQAQLGENREKSDEALILCTTVQHRGFIRKRSIARCRGDAVQTP